jgi:RNA polymerase sigma factor (sigma-70 family)
VEDELAEFCRREHGRLVAALVLVCGSRSTAEDLAQETLARVCRDWPRLQKLEAPGAYVHRMALNLSASGLRRGAAERRAAQRLSVEAGLGRAEPDSAAAIAVREALQTLRLDQRRVLVLRYFLGYSVLETAALLRMPEGSVKTHAQRGLTALRSVLGTPVTAADLVVESV